jgi:hypothetical protein
VIVRARDALRRAERERAGHAQVHQQPALRPVAFGQRKPQIFTSTDDVADDLSEQRIRVASERPSQWFSNAHRLDTAAFDAVREALPRDLDFREFWHAGNYPGAARSYPQT